MLNKKALSATAAAQALYVEDVFSTYLYTGNGSTKTITNGIDLAGEGGMVWIKGRSTTGQRNGFFDTLRGASNFIWSDSTAANNVYSGYGVTNFGSSSFSLGDDSTGGYWVNGNNITYASWTFRKAEKFFDVVTYTGNGSNRTIAHNLGSVPGCIIVKRTDTTGAWQVYHRSLANTEYLVLNTTAAKATGATRWDSTTPTSTVFSLGTDATVNANGGTYVAYIFAHDAGGFGDSGSDNVITCGSYTGDGLDPGPTITLGYEPQWLLIKRATGTAANWYLVDSVRGIVVDGIDNTLYPNLTDAEDTPNVARLTATGFSLETSSGFANNAGDTYIYIAIRRGPMKTPTLGTDVFTPLNNAPTSGVFESNIFTDSYWVNTAISSGSYNNYIYDRLRGNTATLTTCGNAFASPGTAAEYGYSASTSAFQRNEDFAGDAGFTDGDYGGWAFKRAPGFFDTVCYTGTGSNRTISHSLGVVPEFMFVKCRGTSGRGWMAYHKDLGNTKYVNLNTTAAAAVLSTAWNNTTPTSSVFTLGTNATGNANTSTYIWWGFASVSGVSKVGSYTGNGSSQTINCGFTTGARFVLIKRTDSTGNWFVYDTARGLVTGNDAQLLLNSTAAQTNTYDAVDPDNSGFIVNNDATNFPINVNAATYIYLAIA